jgi:hypothetical protein
MIRADNTDDSLEVLGLELSLDHTLIDQIKNSVDEMLSMTAGHQIVSASEMTDKLLDLRILVSKLSTRQGEPHDDND